MRGDSLLDRGRSFYADHGAIRTIGAVAYVCGTAIEDRCWWVQHVLKSDSGKRYPLAVRLRAARHGLSAFAYLWMGVSEADVESYLRSRKPIRELNDGHIEPIHNKDTFHALTAPYIDAVPTLYGRIVDGEFVAEGTETGPGSVLDMLHDAGAAVLKPTAGYQGNGVYVLERRDDGIRINDRPADPADLSALVAGLDAYIVTEFLRQHRYAATVFPAATNTLRVFSIIDPDTGDPAVLLAVHRFGSSESAPTDNWSRGGYCAPVDLETGTLEPLIVLEEPPRSRPDSHPETGARVAGLTVPHWERVCALVRDLAAVHREAPLVGWDVVVTEDGPVVIEGNARPDPKILQPNRGIFEDPRVRRLLDREH